MQVQVHWIEGPWPGRLALAARPRGGDWLYHEALGWRALNIDTVVSLLVPGEVLELDLQDEAEICGMNRIDFVTFPIEDRDVPSAYLPTLRLLDDLESRLNRGEVVLIHCRQGVGRAGMIASALLINRGMTPKSAVQHVSSARGIPVPETREQMAWLDNLSSRMAAARLAS